MTNETFFEIYDDEARIDIEEMEKELEEGSLGKLAKPIDSKSIVSGFDSQEGQARQRQHLSQEKELATFATEKPCC